MKNTKSKKPVESAPEKRAFSWRKAVRELIRVVCNIVVLILAAYGLRHMFAAIKEELSLALTIGIVVLLAYVIHIEQ